MTEAVQLAVQGAALGAVYALIALGFVVIFKATGVVNFAQGSFLLVGAYLTYSGCVRAGVPFPLAVVAAMAGAIAIALAVERAVVRPLAGQPPAAVVLATFGVAIALSQAVTIVWGFRPHGIGDPWGSRTLRVAGVVVSQIDLSTLVITAVALSAFFGRTRRGLALRAAAADVEAAAAVGIDPAGVARWAWGLAAAVAAVAGVLIAAGPASATPGLGDIALRAFPAVILGGFESVGGAVAGGLIVGVVEVFTARYAPGSELVVPYALMLAILLVRPAGIFVAADARRL